MTVHLNYDIEMLCNFEALYKYMGISDDALHYYRYKRHTDKDLICPLCRVVKETDLHFILYCSVLRILRQQFIRLKFYKSPCLFSIKPVAGIHQWKHCDKSDRETVRDGEREGERERENERERERERETDRQTDRQTDR